MSFPGGVTEYSGSIGTTSTRICGENSKRESLIISAPVTHRVSFSLQGAAVLGQGITLYPSGPPLILCRYEIGDAISRPLFGIADTAAENIQVVETLS